MLFPSMILSGGENHCTPLARRSNSDRTSDFKPMTNNLSPDLDSDHPVTRREFWWVVGLLVLAVVLRLAMPGSFHVEHYDEGVYASNRWFTPEEGARFPDRHLYAPPLWPAILEMSQLVLGTSIMGVMLPGIFCGVVTVWLMWRLVREWVGVEVALVTAGLLAVNGYHIMFSRTALTDVPVTMFILWGIAAGWHAVSSERIGVAVWAGLLTGLAWSIKYNGWYPLAVTGAGLAAANLFHAKQSGVAWLRWRCWGVMLITAVVVWIPAWLDLQEHGGYAAVAANHSGYIEGWSYWMENFRRQFENLRWWDLLGRHIGFFSMAVIPLVLSLFGLGLRLVQLVRSAWNHEALTEDILSGWMVLAWVSSLLLVTPLYHPYPRLALPLFLALLVGSGYGLQILSLLWKETQHSDNPALESSSEGSVSRETNVVKIAVWALVSGLISVMMIGFPIAPGHGGTPWDQRRTSAERVAEGIVEECGRLSVRSHSAPIDYVIYVYSEPAIYYHLCRVAPENVLVSPVANLGFLAHPPAREPVPIYLVTGPHAERSDSFRDQLEETKGRLEALFIDQIPVSDLVSLNSYSPEMVLDPPYHFPAAEYQLWLMIDSINSPSE